MPPKNMNTIARKITLLEGGKKSISIAQVREVIGWLSEVMWQDFDTLQILLNNGKRRTLRKEAAIRKKYKK